MAGGRESFEERRFFLEFFHRQLPTFLILPLKKIQKEQGNTHLALTLKVLWAQGQFCVCVFVCEGLQMNLG